MNVILLQKGTERTGKSVIVCVFPSHPLGPRETTAVSPSTAASEGWGLAACPSQTLLSPPPAAALLRGPRHSSGR